MASLQQNSTQTAPSPFLVPLDFARIQRKYTSSTYQVELETSISEQLNQQNTPEDKQAVLLSAYTAWLYRLSAEEEVSFSTFVPQSGLLTASLTVEKETTFHELASLFQEMLREPNAFLAEPQADTSFSTTLPTDSGVESRIMDWAVRDNNGTYQLQIRYDQSLLLETTVVRYAEYFATLLRGALNNSHALVNSIDILSDADRAAHEALNDTVVKYPEHQTIHGMFEEAASQYPDRPAIASHTGEYTYRELNERANQVARVLLSKGLTKGEFVTIFMERSLETVISLLGILKAGGVYVPVDPAHPADRSSYIVEDTRSPFVLTTSALTQQAAELCGSIETVKEILAIDGPLAGYAASNPNVEVSPDDLAYVIYTSGSTGKPKGALIAHRGVVNLGAVVQRDCDITPQDVLTQFATYSFDASVWDTIGALFYGAKLYLLSSEERVSVEEFAEAIERTGTTIITILPTVFFNQLSTYLSDEGYRKLAKVRIVTVAGEALYGSQVRAFQSKFGTNTDIVNVYGPTECTVATTTHRVRGAVPEHVVNIPIGKPIYNYKVYIVNDDNKLCPVNIPGEVCIATPALAHGYLHQPERTAQSFVDNPFVPGEKMYRSGDIAKLLPDGTIEYVSRKDSQLKIRGNRIEIGEIEDHFSKHPGVQDVAVVAVKDHTDQNMLVGYFTTSDGQTIPQDVIQSYIGGKLPSYFVPTHVVHLEAMPISPTGKIDRKKLALRPLPEVSDLTSGGEPLREGTETLIAEAWTQVLGKHNIGATDDFFLIGGDSLRVIHVLAILKPRYGALRIGDFFRYKTVRELAEYVEQLGTEQAPQRKSLAISREKTDLNEHPIELPGASDLAEIRDLRVILLTGATGYLGSHILYDLLHRTEAKVYAMVRPSQDGPSGFERIQSVLTGYFGQDISSLMEGRVKAIYGDLEQADLGLSSVDRHMLEHHIDGIIHSAADVRHFGDSATFDRTNVTGTLELLKIAQAKPGVSFHHVSTMGIPEDLANEGKWESTLELSAFPDELNVDNLYTNSKLAAEKLLFQAAQAGTPVSIYRAGNLTAHSANGRFQRNIDSNAYYRMMKAMLLLGKAPQADWHTDFTPIDYASRAIVELSVKQKSANRIFHICNPNPLPYDELIAMVNQLGYAVETLPFDDYSAWLLNPSSGIQEDALHLAMGQLEGDGAKDSAYRYGCSVTTALLEQAGVQCPVTNLEFIRNMIQHAVEIGYFPASSSVSVQATQR
ncbi:non-ribosomal peptide synthetase family protein [Paenibacillus polymyxa]|uniref:non-ribosomal peptide synthetase family protein n=1 Tax=Paenibacillus polymyxa TaxID=1406 RepID=UPI0018661264|nr:non-ribosomal peptide synthetase [Paenibacillus polymyxa]MBE3648088.1 amino acid adenylation domain-containing protein [Paenibacillus polymyxa]